MADGAQGIHWAAFEDDRKSWYYGKQFSRADIDDAAAWLYNEGLIDGITVAEARGPVAGTLTEGGLECVEDFAGDTKAFVRQRRQNLPVDSVPMFDTLPGATRRSSSGSAAAGPSKVFISYVHQNSNVVEAMVQRLRDEGYEVWLDRTDLVGGQRWKAPIRSAIRSGAAAVAYFSKAFEARDKSYMHEELRR